MDGRLLRRRDQQYDHGSGSRTSPAEGGDHGTPARRAYAPGSAERIHGATGGVDEPESAIRGFRHHIDAVVELELGDLSFRRDPNDLPAFCAKLIEAIGQGAQAGARQAA